MKTRLPIPILFCGLPAAVETASAQTWMQTSAPNADWAGVASSSDGSKLIAADGTSSGGIYTSTNSGATWISNAVPAVGWDSVASSADASLLAAGSASAGVYISTNGGTTWAQPANVTGLLPERVAISANGDIMFFAATGGTNYFFSSTNAGASWKSNSSPALQVVASSADGNKLVAADATGGLTTVGIYTLFNIPSPQLNIAAADKNLMISWIVPSTNFVLQENSGLVKTNWATLTNAPALNLSNLSDEIVLSPSNRSDFFRLVAQ